MPKETVYQPEPLVYKSRGLSARPIQDQVAVGSYLNLLNLQEREENTFSTRYGSQIVNRDPDGTPGGQNYFFSSPIVSLARLIYQQSTYRYAGLGSGILYRRTGDTQGPYTQIYAGLSGQPWQYVVTNCFQSSQPYTFIYDQAVSIKDLGTGSPQLTGIDPPNFNTNTLPYAPLLSLIDNFASANTYTTSGFTGSWAFATVDQLISTGGQIVTDFTQQFGVQTSGGTSYTVAGSILNTSATAPNTVTSTGIYSGFTSVSVPAGSAVSLSLNLTTNFGGSTFPSAVSSINLQYSNDSGATWTTFFSATSAISTYANVIDVTVPGVTNLNQVQIRAIQAVDAFAGTANAISIINQISAIINPTNAFGQVTNGMLAQVQAFSGAINPIPIVSVRAVTQVSGVYTQLLVTTQTAHGLSPNQPTSIYGCSNDLADGFYFNVLSVPSTTTFIVAFTSYVPISATGGTCYSGALNPQNCVLNSQYSIPYPTQLAAWGFYLPVTQAPQAFNVGSFGGNVAQNTTATVGKTVTLDLSQSNQVTDDDLIAVTLMVDNPAAIANVRLQFDISGSGYTSSYYYKDIAPAYYQQGVDNLQDAYTTTEQQIFADALGLLDGQPPNTTTAQLQPANISTGSGSWITVYMRRGDFTPIGTAGNSGYDWSAVTGWQVIFTTNTVGSSEVSINGMYLQWGYGPSSFGGVGYDYRYTYYNAQTGTESNGCAPQEFNTQFGYLSSLAAPIFLRQAVRNSGYFSTDPQVSHVRMYRRGGNVSSNWLLLDQFPNITSGGQFFYKDVIPDSALQQSPPLILDNDPPVTSSLQQPIATTLAAPSASPGQNYYAFYAPQTLVTTLNTAMFVPGQIVQVGLPSNLEEVRVIIGGTGQFTGYVRLQHNAGEPINAYSIPRQTCNLCAIAYNQVWLGGDPNNPNYLYFSKPGRPESFGPQDYIPVGQSNDRIMQIVNWRGTLFVQTLTSWYLIIGGATPYAQPTGSKHGGISTRGTTQTETAIWYRSPDGQRQFQGADGAYMTLPIELLYRQTDPSMTPLPITDPAQATQDVIAFFNNEVYCAYTSTTGQRYRLIYHTIYQRFRIDDQSVTAMLWEQDTNTFLLGKQVSSGIFAVVQDQINDYDDGGWAAGVLVQTPINFTLQTPFQDLGQPHYPKQWNVLETDVNTKGASFTTTLLFNTEPPTSLTLPAFTNTIRNKVQQTISPVGQPGGSGVQAYSMSIQHQGAAIVAPIFYQENIYAAKLADYRQSHDTYWQNLSTDESKLVKQAYFDYTSSQPVIISLYADGSNTAYYTFVLPTASPRAVIRMLFPAMKIRRWRMISLSAGDFQYWDAPKVMAKTVNEGTTYSSTDLSVGS